MHNVSIEAKDIFEKLSDGESITLPVQGKSMQPFLYNGRDSVVLEKPSRRLKRGDVIVFERGGFYIMHRIVKIDSDGFITTLGDYTLCPDTQIPPENVKAVLVSAVRNGKKITPKSLEWLFFSKIFINISVRKLLGGKEGK